MPAVTIYSADGDGRTIEIADGVSVMEGAVRAGVEGIDADCGGALSCATCHIHVSPAWYGRVDPPSADEREMLGFAVDPDETSRLSCQIVMSAALDGLEITVPPTQR